MLLNFKIIFVFLIVILISMLNKVVLTSSINKNIFLASYIKGILLANGYGEIKLIEDKFLLNLNAKTTGIFSLLSKWQQTVSVEGSYQENTFKSIIYKSNEARGKKKGHIYIEFKDGYPTILSAQPDPRKDDRRQTIENNLLKNTLDPVLGIINIGINGQCNKISIIFDGKRKYILKANYVSNDRIRINNFFDKEFKAVKCKFEIEKLAGYTKKELEKYPTSGFIWFKKEKNKNFFFPVKINIESKWGNFVCLIKERRIPVESNNL